MVIIMENSYLKRINELAAKAKSEGLTNEEIEERRVLREKYLAEFRSSFKTILDNTSVKYPDGSRRALKDFKSDRKNR